MSILLIGGSYTKAQVRQQKQKERNLIEQQTKIEEKVKSIETQLDEKTKEIELLKQSRAERGTRVASARTVVPSDNEKIVWDFLIAQGFTREQTAGIMGNLQQEHNFQTTGDGLAQWTGSRKTRLLAMPNPYNLETQLNFLVMEMRESGITLPSDVVGATRVFQNQFERCGACNEIARIRYAKEILARH